MIDTKIKAESFLQRYRFRIAVPYLKGDVMDFGGNNGELRPFVKGNYLVVNYDHSVLTDQLFDTIAALAVIEHIDRDEVVSIFRKLCAKHLRTGGTVVITTPTQPAKPVLELLARTGIIARENIAEHKHYWNKNEIMRLAEECGLQLVRYNRFQFGMNQLAVLKKV